MPTVFDYEFKTPTFSKRVTFPTGLYINGQFVEGVEGKTIDVINPSNGQVVGKVAQGTKADVDVAVTAARTAFKTTWGDKVPGYERGKMLYRLAELIEQHREVLGALEALDNGKSVMIATHGDVSDTASVLRYYAGWADKYHGQTIETLPSKIAITLHEPIGVCGQIIPWNWPMYNMTWKLGPALATGNVCVLKPSEYTPLTACYIAQLINEAGFPAGVVNIINGYGPTAGAAIAEHMDIDKVAFTGSTLVGRSIMQASARTNLKKVTLELGGKSPSIVFNDADLDEAVKFTAFGIYFNHGQACCASSRLYVQSGIYDKFLEKFTARAQEPEVGDPFNPTTFQGPQVSQQQYDRVMEYIESGKQEGATLHLGGGRHGTEGYFIEPTIFTDVKPEMRIVSEEIFGPVVVISKFEDEDEVVEQANDTIYGLAAAVFTQDISRALSVTKKLQAGTVWVNHYFKVHPNVPFGGYGQSGIGRELGQQALANYTNVKSAHLNISLKWADMGFGA